MVKKGLPAKAKAAPKADSPEPKPDQGNSGKSWAKQGRVWKFKFKSQRVASRAAAAINQRHSEANCLHPGGTAKVEGDSIIFKWHQEVKFKSLMDYFWRNLRGVLGPASSGAPCVPENWALVPEPIFKPGSGPAAETQRVADQLQWNCLDQTQWYNKPLAMAGLEEQGFIILRGFVPGNIVGLAHCEVGCYFVELLKGFRGGFAVDEGQAGLPKLLDLPDTAWEKKSKGTTIINILPGNPGFKVDPRGCVTEVTSGGQACAKDVAVGWVLTKVGNSKFSKPLAEKVFHEKTGFKATFDALEFWHPAAIDQKWGVQTTRGYMNHLGLGKCTGAKETNIPSVMATQHYMSHYIAFLEGVRPGDLCWQPDRFSLKTKNAPGGKPHRDIHDLGRYQAVIALSQGFWEGWPCSHKLEPPISLSSSSEFPIDYLEQHCKKLSIPCQPGDVFIFVGGTFVHRSPAVGPDEFSPRVMTYAKFWPPGTTQWRKHDDCKCPCHLFTPQAFVKALGKTEGEP